MAHYAAGVARRCVWGEEAKIIVLYYTVYEFGVKINNGFVLLVYLCLEEIQLNKEAQ